MKYRFKLLGIPKAGSLSVITLEKSEEELKDLLGERVVPTEASFLKAARALAKNDFERLIDFSVITLTAHVFITRHMAHHNLVAANLLEVEEDLGMGAKL